MPVNLKRKMETTECTECTEITEALEGAPFIPKVRLGFLNNHSKSVYSVYSVVLISESRINEPEWPVMVGGRRSYGKHAMKRFLFILMGWLASVSLSLADDLSPWPSAVPGWHAPTAGGHPRLFFRKADLPALRQKARTPEGQAIVKRLRLLLNGGNGETMPTVFPKATAAYQNVDKNLPVGAYTLWHGAGYGLLFQLTGDQKYAALGRESVEKAMAGVRDRDDRYALVNPGGFLRAGPSVGAIAMAYDLCYDGWDEEFRRKVAVTLQHYDGGHTGRDGSGQMTMERLALKPQMHPGSNHWGMEVGGAAQALLAIMNDPGVDMEKLQPMLNANIQCLLRNLTQGFGDGGFFAEGDGTGSMSSHIAFLSGLQAWKIAGGKDFIAPRPNVPWLTLKWAFLTVPTGKNPLNLRDGFPERGAYPHNIWERTALSGAGYFAFGFGCLPGDYQPGLLWFYNHHLKAADDKAGTPCDTTSVYPHDAVLAFINWPVGLPERNPGDVMPHAYRDTKWGFYAWRNRWQDQDDTVISILTRTAKGNYAVRAETALTIWSEGQRLKWGNINGGFTGTYQPTRNGSTVLTTGDGGCLAIDFSHASGLDTLLVLTGPGATGSMDGKRAKAVTVSVGEVKYSVLMLSANGQFPEPKADGDRLAVGGQAIGVRDGRLVLTKQTGKP